MSLTLTRRYNVDRFGYFIPHRYGNLPMVGAVATYRPGEGRFGRGAVAVEEGTTNLMPLDKQKFEGWTAHDGASVTLTQNQVVPEWGALDATRIQSSGGTNTLKYSYHIASISGACAWSIWIKNNGLSTVFFEGNKTLAQQAILPGESKRVIITRSAGDAITMALRFYTNAIDDAMDIMAWRPQVEAKPFATSFVAGTRAEGRLEYPQSIWNHVTGTFAAWVKTPTDVTTDRVLTLQWAKDDINAHTRFGIRMNTSGRFVASYGSIDTLTTADSYNDGQWHHIALTWVDGTADVHLYVDGERVASADSPISLSNLGGRWGGVIPIGHRGYNYRNQWWNGLIDELLILPYAASEEEIASWYEAQGPLPPHPQALLQWDWQAVRPAQIVKL